MSGACLRESLVRWCVVLAIVLWGARVDSPALARQASAPISAVGVPARSGQEIAIGVELFGVGGVVRPGDWAGLRVTLSDSAPQARTVVVRWHVVDSDGDTALYSRTVTVNPAVPMGVWLYARLPWNTQSGGGAGSIFKISVVGAEVGDDGSVRLGRQLGAARISPSRTVSSAEGLLGIVGRSGLGLEPLSASLDNRPGLSASAHEVVQVVGGLTPASLPDQWEGWGSFRALVWSEGDPAELAGDGRSGAIREWVHRGGHFIVVMPSVGNPWTAPGNPLADLLPSAKIERLQDVDLTRYANLLTNRDEDLPALARPAAIHRFVPLPDTETADAAPIISGPEGCVVMRRLLGAGMVTVIGFDLSSRSLAQRQLPAADAFWNRILGRRGDVLTYAEAQKLGNTGFARLSDGRWVDGGIAGVIAKSRTASVGILMGLIVFAAYWLAAGPLGFGLLKSRGLERHAWVAFIAVAGLFTLVAWTGASTLRPKHASVGHYTLLDHVYGQAAQRARSFASVLLPEYGEERVAIGDPASEGPWLQALTPWTDPESETNQSFPDSRDYLAEVRRLSGLTVPARSTIKQFQADWLGRCGWSMPVAISPDERPAVTGSGGLRGTLKHGLPAALTNVQIVYVRGQTPEAAEAGWRTSRLPRGVARFEAFAWARDSWKPGELFDLSSLQVGSGSTAIRWLDDLVPKIQLGSGFGDGELRGNAELLTALLGVVGPPDYESERTGVTRAILRARMVHTWDLSKWFTQPCLIVIGLVQDSVCPVPFAVDGRMLHESPETCRGTTVVRWIYPLPARPAEFGGLAPTRPASERVPKDSGAS